MLYDSEAIREVYLIFQDEHPYFCSQLFKPGFKHVFAIERQALGWICIDPSRYDFCSTILPAGYHDTVIDTFIKQNPSMSILRIDVSPLANPSSIYPKPHVMSCVGVIQYLLGVYWPWIWSPYKLYCKLLKLDKLHLRTTSIWVGKEPGAKHKQPQKQADEKLKPLDNKQSWLKQEPMKQQSAHNDS